MMVDTDCPEISTTGTEADTSTHTSDRKSARPQRIEVITRGERRRRWSLEAKQAIVAESLEVDYPNLGKFARATHEFAVYITSNTGSLINYGERYRAGERISSCLAESTVNAVISKRFAKRQQMQWTPRGAHLLHGLTGELELDELDEDSSALVQAAAEVHAGGSCASGFGRMSVFSERLRRRYR